MVDPEGDHNWLLPSAFQQRFSFVFCQDSGELFISETSARQDMIFFLAGHGFLLNLVILRFGETCLWIDGAIEMLSLAGRRGRGTRSAIDGLNHVLDVLP